MAESEISKPEPDNSGFDPKTMRETKPGLKRLSITLSVLFSFLIGFRFLWKSVEIYRSPLPFNDIDSLSTEIKTNPNLFPYHFKAIFFNFTTNQQTLKSSLYNEITKLTSNPHNFTLSVLAANDDSQMLNFGVGGDDGSVDEALKKYWGGDKVYSVVVVNGGEGGGARAVVGKYRHAWISSKGLKEEEVVAMAAEIFVKVFANGGVEEEDGVIGTEFMPVGADGRIVLSFNLLNANPNNWVYDW